MQKKHGIQRNERVVRVFFVGKYSGYGMDHWLIMLIRFKYHVRNERFRLLRKQSVAETMSMQARFLLFFIYTDAVGARRNDDNAVGVNNIRYDNIGIVFHFFFAQIIGERLCIFLICFI